MIHVTGPGDPVELAGSGRPAQGANRVSTRQLAADKPRSGTR